MRDILKKSDLDNTSDFLSTFDIVYATGRWFVDMDDVITSSSYGQNTISDSSNVIFLMPKKNGKLVIGSFTGNEYDVDIYYSVTNSTSSLSVYIATETGGKYETDSNYKLNLGTGIATHHITSEPSAITITTNDIVALSVSKQKVATLDIE